MVQILMPAAVWYALARGFRSNGARVFSPNSSFSRNLGFFFLDYSAGCYYWEFTKIVQRSVFIGVIIIFQSQQLLKGIFILIFQLFYGYFTYSLRPIKNTKLQETEILSTCIQILATLCTLSSVDSKGPGEAVI